MIKKIPLPISGVALGFAALAAMVVVVLMSYAQLTSISADVVSMQKELKTLDAEHVALLTQYERTFDLETVKAAAAAAGIAIECELADGKNRAANILEGAVHFTRFILKNAEIRHFFRHIVDVVVGIVSADADKHHEALLDGADLLAGDADGGLGNSLNDTTHRG